ncbi:MAG: DUF4186 family protein [Rhabdochlamydiaceae bacterium]
MLIDWKRLDKRRLTDSQYTFQQLKYELVRHHYWHEDIDKKSFDTARKLGVNGLRMWAENRLERYVSQPVSDNPWDGRQTPKDGHIVFYAQHAIACCCRQCMEEWHGIERDRPLTKSEINYFVELIMLYVQDRIPDIPKIGEKLPRIKSRRSKELRK